MSAPRCIQAGAVRKSNRCCCRWAALPRSQREHVRVPERTGKSEGHCAATAAAAASPERQGTSGCRIAAVVRDDGKGYATPCSGGGSGPRVGAVAGLRQAALWRPLQQHHGSQHQPAAQVLKKGYSVSFFRPWTFVRIRGVIDWRLRVATFARY
jgi:hypothetical protein